MTKNMKILAEEIGALRLALAEQWLAAHAEYCGCEATSTVMDECQWPLPRPLARLGEATVEKVLRHAMGL